MYEEQPAIIDWLFSYKKQDYKKPSQQYQKSLSKNLNSYGPLFSGFSRKIEI